MRRSHSSLALISFGLLLPFITPSTAYANLDFITEWDLSSVTIAEPTKIAANGDNIFLAQNGHYEILKFLPNGTLVDTWGEDGSGPGQFIAVEDISADFDFVYAVDAESNNRVQKFHTNGTYISQWGSTGSGTGEFSAPHAIALDPSGFVYVGDETGRIQKFDANGNFVLEWVSAVGSGPCSNHVNIAASADGFVYVMDEAFCSVKKFDGDGTLITTWGSQGTQDGQFNDPQGISVDQLGNVYVADTNNNRIQVFDADGNFITKRNATAWGIAVDPSGLVYVTDNTNDKIQVFSPLDVQPVANPDYVQLGEDVESIQVYVLTNDTDPNQLSLSVVSVSDPTNGTAYVSNGTSIVYIPDPNFVGIEIFNYTISNGLDGNTSFVQAFVTPFVLIDKWDVGSADSVDPRTFSYNGQNVFLINALNTEEILRFSSNGTLEGAWGSQGSGQGQFNGLVDIVAAQNDYNFVYAVDQGNSRIQKFHTNGTFVLEWGSFGSGPGEFNNPTWIAFDHLSGFVYVGDENSRIQKFDANGNFILDWTLTGGSGGCISAMDMAVDIDGDVYVIDKDNCRIKKFDGNGNLITTWGSQGTGDGQFNDPQSIFVDIDRVVYVADTNNNRIQLFSKDGVFATTWGNLCDLTTQFGCIDPDGAGPLELGDGQFNAPYSMDYSSDIYVLDNNRHFQVFLAPNLPPVADAGEDQLIASGMQSVMLDGTASHDPDFDALSFDWIQIDGDLVTLNNANTTTPSFTVPSGFEDGTFLLTVTDSYGGTNEDSVVVTLNSTSWVAIQSGDWSDPATWNTTPPITINSGDTVTIPSGITVIISQNTTVTNSGVISNSGTIENVFGKLTLTSSGTVSNLGSINNYCRGIIVNNGTLSGNPVTDACYDGIVAYRSATGVNGANSPKIKLWRSDNQTFTNEVELPTAGSPINNIAIKDSTISEKIVLITQSNDGNLDAYVCMTDCAQQASWTVSNNIGQIASSSVDQRRFDLNIDSSGNAIVVYSILSTNTTRDLAYKVLPSQSSSFSAAQEQYIDDDSSNGNTNLQYTWLSIDKDPDMGSDEMILVGYDSTGSDVNSWVWSTNTWSNRMEISTSATATGGEEALAVRYASDGSKGIVMSSDGTSGNIIARYWNGVAWSSPSIFDIDSSNAADAKWIRLKADPATDDMQALIVDSSADLTTAYWSGTAFAVTSNVDTSVDASTSMHVDYAWNRSGSTGKLIWDSDGSGTTLYERTCSPQCTSSTTTITTYGGTGRWLSLYTDVVSLNPIDILGMRLNNAQDIGSFGWNGNTFTNYGDAKITQVAGITTSQVYSVILKQISSIP